MEVTLVVNPVASSLTRRALVVIKKALAADHDLTVMETTRKGQAIRMAHGAARAGADVIVALGGDGTINEVANGVLGDDCMIAPLPGGSTNVFARSVGYPNDAVEATAVLLEALAAGSFRSASVGEANGRAFLFHVGMGFDAEVVDRVERRGYLKRYMGHPLFMAAAVATWMRTGTRRPFSVTTDDGRTIDDALMAVALNTTPYTYLGTQPLHLAPEASLSAPLSMVVLTSLSPRMVPLLVTATRNQRGLANKAGAHHLVDVEGAMVSGDEPFHYQLDGESMDPVRRLVLRHRPDAVRLVVPVDGG
ncbi:MAG: diacylglycerol kinase family protein [Actinomycetota bacterium]